MSEPGALAGTHILITGGATGIGFACAKRLRADGAIVTIMGRARRSSLKLASR